MLNKENPAIVGDLNADQNHFIAWKNSKARIKYEWKQWKRQTV